MNDNEFVIARVQMRLLATEEGGRKTPFFSFVYIPQFSFGGRLPSRSGQILLTDRDEMHPGEQGEAVLRFGIFPGDTRPLPSIHDSFVILEGPRTVGEGVILELLDELPAYRRKEQAMA